MINDHKKKQLFYCKREVNFCHCGSFQIEQISLETNSSCGRFCFENTSKMFSKSKTGSSGLWKSKTPHSLEYLKYLYGILAKNPIVTESNRVLLVEVLRSMAEILIWGDQNDSTVFDFFLEKNMLSFFLRIMKQKCGRFVCVQLLQTLNILFENLRNETSLYYLLSNNMVNQIITHRFDFSDEEIMAYYISFLKTLSLKLNNYTIHFYFNEATNDFPLYTEAIKFFNHSESMVRIAVRTLTLNVYRISVNYKPMLSFIRDKTAAPYFSNLVWFIGNHIAEIDNCIRTDNGHANRERLADLAAEHLDHIHYVNDILSLEITSLNEVLTDQLMQRLFLPLYLHSLLRSEDSLKDPSMHISVTCAMFLLSEVFFVITHSPLVDSLAKMIFFGNSDVIRGQMDDGLDGIDKGESCKPVTAVELCLDNSTDEEKLCRLNDKSAFPTRSLPSPVCSLLSTLECVDGDYNGLFALFVLYAVVTNKGLMRLSSYLDLPFVADRSLTADSSLRDEIKARLIHVICLSSSKDCIRLLTLELCTRVLDHVAQSPGEPILLNDQQLSAVICALRRSEDNLKALMKEEDLFLDIFEDEFSAFSKTRHMNISHISSDAILLLAPLNTPLSGVELLKRHPCGAQEHTRKAIRVYLILRQLVLQLKNEPETKLPLTNPDECVKVQDRLDLSNSDMLACIVVHNDIKHKRFLVTDGLQMILVEPDSKQMGWGVVRFVGFLQDLEVTGDKEDSRALHILVHQQSGKAKGNVQPLLTAKFLFDDHIRCMAAKQRLTKGRQKARQYKMDLFGSVLNLRSDPVLPPRSFVIKREGTSKVPGYISIQADRQTPHEHEHAAVEGDASSAIALKFSYPSLASKSLSGKISKEHSAASEDEHLMIPLEELTLCKTAEHSLPPREGSLDDSADVPLQPKRKSSNNNPTIYESCRTAVRANPKAKSNIADASASEDGQHDQSSDAIATEHDDALTTSSSAPVLICGSDSANASTNSHVTRSGIEIRNCASTSDDETWSSLQCFTAKPKDKKCSIQNL